MDENVVFSKQFGRVTFIAAAGNSDKPKDTCQKCLLMGQEECLEARCAARVRTDGRNGYFSIHQMPKEKRDGKPDGQKRERRGRWD